jgi:hypothetical protein
MLQVEISVKCKRRISLRKLWPAIKLVAIVGSTYLVSNGFLPKVFYPTTWHERGVLVRSAHALSYEVPRTEEHVALKLKGQTEQSP